MRARIYVCGCTFGRARLATCTTHPNPDQHICKCLYIHMQASLHTRSLHARMHAPHCVLVILQSLCQLAQLRQRLAPPHAHAHQLPLVRSHVRGIHGPTFVPAHARMHACPTFACPTFACPTFACPTFVPAHAHACAHIRMASGAAEQACACAHSGTCRLSSPVVEGEQHDIVHIWALCRVNLGFSVHLKCLLLTHEYMNT